MAVVLYSAKVAGQLAMLCTFILYHIAFTSFGVSSMIVDVSIREDLCGKSTHLWKYTLLNTIFSTMTVITFGVFPGGGEGARARALMITILHFGFSVWGVLLWSKLPECLDVINTKHHQIYLFHVLCVWHNAVFLMLYIFHELYLGDKMGGDLTLMPEVHKQEVLDYSYAGVSYGQQGENSSLPLSTAASNDLIPAPSGGDIPTYMQNNPAPLASSKSSPHELPTETPQRGL